MPTMRQLAADYEQRAGVPLRLVSGATGKLYAQLVQGAPYDVFFAADAERPRRLEAEGHAVAGSRVTYAVGRLVLWRPGGRVQSVNALLDDAGRIAMANPRLAPYGQAARTLLVKHDLWPQLQGRLVFGENVTQVYQYAYSGQVSWALLPLSLLARSVERGQFLLIDPEQHAPLHQQAVLLKSGRVAAAREFLDYCQSKAARQRIKQAGYDLPDMP